MKITDNFCLSEFTNAESVSGVVMTMLNRLCATLEAFREFWGNMPVIVTSGIRNGDDYHRLLSQGYYPSATSDHFFGYPVKIPESQIEKRKRYGEFYTMSVGAVDVVPSIGVKKAFEMLFTGSNIDRVFGAISDTGQIIYEKHGNAEWIHISNHPTVIYQSKIRIQAPRFLESLDGGKSYRVVAVY